MNGRNDALTGSAIEMTTPVRYHAVAAIRTIAPAPIAQNGMIWNAGRDRDLVDRDNKTVIRRQGIDAIGKSLQMKGRRIRLKIGLDDLANGEQLARCFHQH